MEVNTAGIIGLGKIGSIVAKKLSGCNMNIIAYDQFAADEKFKKMGIKKCETLDELLRESDLISIHTPKTPQTYGMIGEKELKICKKGVRIVNAARSGIVNEKALYNAIKEGIVAAAAIDVLDPEPNYGIPPEKQDYRNSLLELDNVIITPHIGASTEEATYNVGTEIASLVCGSLNDEIVPAVNMPQMKATNLSEMKPYLDLAEMLGKIYYQSENETVQRIEIVYYGELAEKDTEAISLSVLKGFLTPVNKDKVNYVNAGYLLKNMGIDFTESRSTYLDKYTNLITVKFYTNTRELSVSGTVFAKEYIRIVDFFGYKLDFEPTPFVIAIQNVDTPGIIGKIGTVLGENDINIAAMQWSRNKKGEKAVSFVSIDEELSDIILNKIKKIEGVLKASKLKF